MVAVMIKKGLLLAVSIACAAGVIEYPGAVNRAVAEGLAGFALAVPTIDACEGSGVVHAASVWVPDKGGFAKPLAALVKLVRGRVLALFYAVDAAEYTLTEITGMVGLACV